MQPRITRSSPRRWQYTFALTVGLFPLSLVRGQDSPSRLTFEVASIKLTTVKLFENKYSIQALASGESYSVRNAPVQALIGAMYKAPWQEVTGGPDWVDKDGYDIEAKADRSHPPDDLRVMFQNLLADRFKLKFHKEIKEGAVYILTANKSGAKLKVSEAPVDPTRSPLLGGGVWEGVSMAYFCRWLRGALQSQQLPIIDKTGLDKNLPEFPPNFDIDRLDPAYRALPSIFDALEQQLGLTLQRQKGPIEYLVIDHVERPTEN